MKKVIFISVLSLFSLIMLAGMFYVFWSPVFDMVIPLPEFPVDMQVYKIVQPEVTSVYVADLGAKFGLTGEVGQVNSVYVMYDEATGASLEVYAATGAFRYSISSKLFPQETPLLPSDEEAMKIATDYLIERDLLPGGDVAASVTVGGSANGQPGHLLVNFENVIQTAGPGAKDSVRIGNGGEVVDVFLNIPKYIPYQVAALKPVKQTYQELKKTRNKFTGMNKLLVSIDSVAIVYWLEPVRAGQEYVYPVYVFKGQALDITSRPSRSSYTGWVEATEESSIDFPSAE